MGAIKRLEILFQRLLSIVYTTLSAFNLNSIIVIHGRR